MLRPIACKPHYTVRATDAYLRLRQLRFGAPEVRNGEGFYETSRVHSSAGPHGHAGACARRDGPADEPSAHDAERADDGRQHDGEPFCIGWRYTERYEQRVDDGRQDDGEPFRIGQLLSFGQRYLIG